MEHLKPSSFKFWCTLFILLAGWIVNWVSDEVMVFVFSADNPEFMSSLTAAMLEAMGTEGIDNENLYTFGFLFWSWFSKTASAIVLAYIGSCFLEFIANNQIAQRRKQSLESVSDNDPA